MEIQFDSSLVTTIFFFLLIFFNIVIKLKMSKSPKTGTKFPPGPWKLPFIGSIHHLAGSELPHRSLRALSRRYGPIMHLQLGEISAVVVSSPRTAKEIMGTHDLAFANRPELASANILSYGNLGIALAPHSEYWRQMRRIITMELLSGKNVRSFSSIREDEIRRLVVSIKLSLGSPISISDKTLALTNAMTSRAAFGRRSKFLDELIPLVTEVLPMTGGFDICDLFPSLQPLHYITGKFPKLARLHRKVDNVLDDVINEHRHNPGGNDESRDEDIVDVLLRLQETDEFEFPIADMNIKAVILEMFSAGTDTSSKTIEWAMSEIMRHPRVMKKVQDELRHAFRGKDTIHETDVQNLGYFKSVVKETMRLHPVLPLLLPRECRKECEIDGYKIPLKTYVIINAWAIGRDPGYWDDAESFLPERFEESSVDYKGNSFQYIPFGAGRRMCPGISFGLANVELPLAQLLYQFNWRLPDGIKPEDLDMTETFGVTIARKKSLFLIPTLYDPLTDY